MEASVRKRGDYLIVAISGRLELEPVEVFRQHCYNHLGNEKFVFDLQGLSFVGSTGIKSFLDILGNLVKIQSRPLKMINASSEYIRIFSSHLEHHVEFFETEDQALQSFTIPQPAPAVQVQPQLSQADPNQQQRPLMQEEFVRLDPITGQPVKQESVVTEEIPQKAYYQEDIQE